MPYPIVVNLAGKRCVVVGAGRIAERRILGLLAEDAVVRVVAPQATDEIARLAGQGTIEWERGAYSPNTLEGATLVFAATDHAEVNEAVARDCASKNLLVCRVDDSAAGGFSTPALVRRGDLLIAVSTAGKSPTLSAVLKARLEVEFGPEWALWTELFGKLRARLQAISAEPDRRKAMVEILAKKDVRAAVAAGDIAVAEEKAISCLPV